MNDKAKDFYWMPGVALKLVDPPKPQDLKHYGVKGMKWGVRKKDDLTGRDKGQSAKPLSKKRSKQVEMVGNFKSKSILTLAAIADTFTLGLTGLAMTVVSDSYGSRKAMEESAESRMLEATLDMRQKKKPLTIDQDIKAVNPKYIGLANGYHNNCSNVTMAYELRRRGYDVTAKPLFGGRPSNEIDKMFGSPEFTSMKPSYERGNKVKPADQVRASIGKQPEGARGAIRVRYEGSGMGHIFNWEMTNTGVRFIDAQDSGRKRDRPLNNAGSKISDVVWFRTDNAKIDMKLVGNSVKNRGSK